MLSWLPARVQNKLLVAQLLFRAGLSLAHKNVNFDPFWPPMTPKTVSNIYVF